ncbi:helix-turn-helix domain-containing protein [Streptomyces sp. NPDC056656]|uniref:helix-turn-helix domain-containing protein n=1 Tax=Streptomyces sp. NPDC056656 TaxID=3345895 RepID=UPI0036A3B45C
MDYDTGHVRYCLDELAARIGVSRATVKRHVAVLRELGALAWVVHGTKTNFRRALGMKGYAATATVYAAVIPPVYDHAMGHTIVGSGYEARAIVDQRSQGKPVDNSPVDNAGSEACEPPSLTLVKEESQVQMVGGLTTPRTRGANCIPSPTRPTSAATTGAVAGPRPMSSAPTGSFAWCASS